MSTSSNHDVLIVGGGPAGSTCARFLADAGLDVALFERCGSRPVKRTSAGIFDHTWNILGLRPDDYPGPIRSPHAFDFDTLKDREPLPDVLPYLAPFLKRRLYFPNRDEFDVWLLELAQKAGAQVIHDATVRPTSIDRDGDRYLVETGGEVHSAKFLVGAAGTRCPVYRRFFEALEPPGSDTMLLTEVEAPESEYLGPKWASYFGFVRKDVFAWTFVVGDGHVHIGTAAISKGTASKKDMLFDDFVEFLEGEDYLASDFDPKDHHTSGGVIRMFGKAPTQVHDGRCLVIGDAAGLLQRDAYNGISNAILSGRLGARAIATTHRTGRAGKDIRRKLHRFLFQDVLHDMAGGLLRPLRRV